jgi:hypothetical protein
LGAWIARFLDWLIDLTSFQPVGNSSHHELAIASQILGGY